MRFRKNTCVVHVFIIYNSNITGIKDSDASLEGGGWTLEEGTRMLDRDLTTYTFVCGTREVTPPKTRLWFRVSLFTIIIVTTTLWLQSVTVTHYHPLRETHI